MKTLTDEEAMTLFSIPGFELKLLEEYEPDFESEVIPIEERLFAKPLGKYYIALEFEATPYSTGVGKDQDHTIRQHWELLKEEKIKKGLFKSEFLFLFTFYGYEILNTTKYEGLKMRLPTIFIEAIKDVAIHYPEYWSISKLRKTRGLERYF